MPKTTLRFDGRELRVRLAKKDETRLAKLARHYEMTESDVIRRLIADATNVIKGS